MTPIYFAGRLYEDNKKTLLKLYESFGVLWDTDEKAWIGEKGKIKGAFEGFKKPALLSVEGSEEFVNSITEFCKSVGAEIRDVEIKDIRDARKEESEKKEKEREILLSKENEIERRKRELEGEIELSRLHVIQNKVITMRRMAGMSDESIEWWIRKETGVEIELTEDAVSIISIGEPDPYSKEDFYKEIENKNKSKGEASEEKTVKKSAEKDEPKKEVFFDQMKIVPDE